MSEFEYQIGGKTYEQKILVWGQVRQLTNLLKDFTLGPNMTVQDVIGIIGDKMPSVLAIVLNEKGANLKDKDIEKLAEDLSFDVTIDLVVKVIEDFFLCNPTALYLEKISSLIGGIREKANQTILSQEQSSS